MKRRAIWLFLLASRPIAALDGAEPSSPAAATAAEAEAGGIWDGPVLEQPFDRRPFRQVRIPAWVRETVGVGYTLSGQGSEARARAAALGVTISELGFVDPFYPPRDDHAPAERWRAVAHSPLQRPQHHGLPCASS